MMHSDNEPDNYRDMADFERKRRREMSSCYKCGSPDPVRLGVEGCSDCYDGWPRCATCGGWADVFNHDHGDQGGLQVVDG